MLVSDFNFHLPEDLIAQHPPAIRGASRMLRVDRTSGALTDDHFRNLPLHLHAGDLLILNDSRVLPARLFATRAPGPRTQHNSPDPSGRIEVLLTQQIAPHTWSALVRPARKVQPGETLQFFANLTPKAGVPHSSQSPRDEWEVRPLLSAEVLSSGDFGERTLRFAPDPHFLEHLERIGHMPLPPYIHRPKHEPDQAEDKSRYQTVYAAQPGSAAAPTAGLHFTPQILGELEGRGVQIARLTLHVGLGTFQPVRVDRLEDIRLHTEHYTLPAVTAAAIQSALRDRRRIIAAGTTTTRTLEHCAQIGNLEPHAGSTSIFLAPGHRFQIVSGLLTNFHLPQSTLLMLVAAFLNEDEAQGRELALHAYAHAIDARYRFFSYGDCMLIL
jgi:S-adenosylmethionine:tRNA ribosyltransferase-isomerase